MPAVAREEDLASLTLVECLSPNNSLGAIEIALKYIETSATNNCNHKKASKLRLTPSLAVAREKAWRVEPNHQLKKGET